MPELTQEQQAKQVASMAADAKNLAWIENNFLHQCEVAATESGTIVTIFLNRTSHRTERGPILVAQLKARLRVPTLYRYGSSEELNDQETLELSGGYAFSTQPKRTDG